MSDPRRGPETGGRSLADILREAGVESPKPGRRRRGDTGEEPVARQRGFRVDEAVEESPVRQRGTLRDERRGNPLSDSAVRQRGSRAGADTGRVTDRSADGPAYGRRAADVGTPPPVRPPDPVKARGRTAVDPAEVRARSVPASPPAGVRRRAPEGPSTAAIQGLRVSRKPGVPGADGEQDATTSTGPIPVVRADDPPELDDDRAASGALAWVRFGGELLVALAVGVGIYLLFSVLWEQLPRVTVVIAPLAVTALVGAVGAWRHRFGGEAPGLRLIVVLVFAGVLLTVAPAAALVPGP